MIPASCFTPDGVAPCASAASAHLVGVALGLHAVMLELLEDLRVVGGRDHAVEHAQHVLLHRVRVVDVADELFLDGCHAL
jgi:hypothetical protein